MARKINPNFKKFIKLASLVKKCADSDPILLDFIISESESKSKKNWNKIQKWTSKNLFQQFKDLPLSKFTLKNVQKFIDKVTGKDDSEGCDSVFSIPDADIFSSNPFELESKLLSFPKNLKIQLQLGNFNTGITKVNLLPIGSGVLTQMIRDMYPNISDIDFERIRIKGKPNNFKPCNYFIKAIFDFDEFTADEQDRFVNQSVDLSKLSEEERAERLRRKKQAKADLKAKQNQKTTKKQIREKKLPKELEKKEVDLEFLDLEKIKSDKLVAFDNASARLERFYQQGIITKQELKENLAKLVGNLKDGGVI